jgi:carboxylesterase type B
MISFLLPYLAVFFTSFAAASISCLDPVVALPQGSYAGIDTIPGQIFFGGIAYAQFPLGDLRWKTPLRVEDAKEGQGVKDTSNWGSTW